jgi:hypothetical protein
MISVMPFGQLINYPFLLQIALQKGQIGVCRRVMPHQLPMIGKKIYVNFDF